MPGPAHSQFVRCSDGRYYDVQFKNNPQGIRVLANELLGTMLARSLGLPVLEPAIVSVPLDLIQNSEDMTIRLGNRIVPCDAGSSFGCAYPAGDSFSGVAELYGFLPDAWLGEIENPADFVGMLVFDKWTGKVGKRRTVFVRRFGKCGASAYRVRMVNQGHCFGGSKWEFKDVGEHGLYYRPMVYSGIHGLDSFDPWLDRLEHRINHEVLKQAAEQIPPEWYEWDLGSLAELIATLNERRSDVRELLIAKRDAFPELFPSWIPGEGDASVGRYCASRRSGRKHVNRSLSNQFACR